MRHVVPATLFTVTLIHARPLVRVSLTSEPHHNKGVTYSMDTVRYVCRVFDKIFSITLP